MRDEHSGPTGHETKTPILRPQVGPGVTPLDVPPDINKEELRMRPHGALPTGRLREPGLKLKGAP